MRAGVWQSASECGVCQSFMKSIPLSQVSFGRGVGQEGRSSGVKDNRIGWLVWVHYTVTQYLHFLSFLSLSAAVGLNHQDLHTQLSSTWAPYWQDNFGILHSLPMDTKVPPASDNTWRVQVNPADSLSQGVHSSFPFSLWILKDSSLWIPLLDRKTRERVWLKVILSLLCLCTLIKSFFPQLTGGEMGQFFTFHSLDDYAMTHLISMTQ